MLHTSVKVTDKDKNTDICTFMSQKYSSLKKNNADICLLITNQKKLKK